jgi:Protein of unknown function (DUF3223)
MLIIIGSLEFPTKKAAKKHFQQMLWRLPTVTRVPDSDAAELLALLRRHPDFEAKQGAGISHFRVKDTLYGARGFEAIRVDGSQVDFSLHECITASSMRAKVQAALRAEVMDDIIDRKVEYFKKHGDYEGKIPCAVTGKMIAIDEAHADHAPPHTFGALANLFLEARGLTQRPAAILTSLATIRMAAIL